MGKDQYGMIYRGKEAKASKFVQEENEISMIQECMHRRGKKWNNDKDRSCNSPHTAIVTRLTLMFATGVHCGSFVAARGTRTYDRSLLTVHPRSRILDRPRGLVVGLKVVNILCLYRCDHASVANHLQPRRTITAR